MNYTPVCFISLHQNGLPSGLWAKLCLVTIIKVTAESVHCLWLEPTASWGLIILTNDTKASERGAADGSGTTFALLLCYWLFFFPPPCRGIDLCFEIWPVSQLSVGGQSKRKTAEAGGRLEETGLWELNYVLCGRFLYGVASVKPSFFEWESSAAGETGIDSWL